MKGRSRLEVKNELTESLLLLDFPKITFLESRHLETEYGKWDEYYILLRLRKVETPEYFKFLMFQTNIIFNYLKKFEIQESGIQEIECGDYYYNLLIYAINNGEEKENSKQSEYDELFREY